ncbi:MAG: hypothetical protein GY859_04255 [Desulfobacterales bacterium]|nr:hypothetical protein [Desulfobacterales bacterium]
MKIFLADGDSSAVFSGKRRGKRRGAVGVRPTARPGLGRVGRAGRRNPAPRTSDMPADAGGEGKRIAINIRTRTKMFRGARMGLSGSR